MLSALELFWLGWQPNLRCFCLFLCSSANMELPLSQAIWCSCSLKALNYKQMVSWLPGLLRDCQFSTFPLVLPLCMAYIFCNPKQGRMIPWSCQYAKGPHGAPCPTTSAERPALGKSFCGHSLASAHKLIVFFTCSCLGSPVAFWTMSVISLWKDICH